MTTEAIQQQATAERNLAGAVVEAAVAWSEHPTPANIGALHAAVARHRGDATAEQAPAERRVEIPAGPIVAVLVPPFEMPAFQLEVVDRFIERTIAEHTGPGPVVLVMSEPGWQVHVLPQRGLDTAE